MFILYLRGLYEIDQKNVTYLFQFEIRIKITLLYWKYMEKMGDTKKKQGLQHP